MQVNVVTDIFIIKLYILAVEGGNKMETTKVYLASDIQRALSLGRSKTYQFLEEVYQKQEPFRVIKVGKLFRVPQKSFDEWLDAAK